MEIKHCPVCHSNYVPNIPKDVVFHRKYHDQFLYGVKANVLKTDTEIFNSGEFRVIVITPKSPYQQRKRAEKVAFRAKRDTNFDFASYHSDETQEKDSPLVFIGIVNKRAISMLVFRKTTKSAKLCWVDYENRENKRFPLLPDERWTIAMIWTLGSKRNQGYAKKLLTIAAEYVGNSITEIAWTTPFTKFGLQFAKSVVAQEVILTV